MNRTYSHTKRSVFVKCPRQYFFEYYAAGVVPQPVGGQKRLFDHDHSPHATIDARISEGAGRLKDLSNCYQCAGQVLHRLIARHLRGHETTRDEWLRMADGQFTAAVRRSSSARQGSGSPVTPAPGMLLDFYYGHPDAIQMAETVRGRLALATACFLDHPGIRHLVHDMLQGQQVLIEQHIGGLPKIDDYGIQGQVDFASRGPGGVRIVDWKMGSSAGDDESLQLVIYARWAMTQFAVLADEVTVQRVFLGDGTIEPEWRMDQQTIRRGWARLFQDIEGMRQLDEYGRTGVMDAFTPCGKERVCRQCKFQEICEARSTGPSSKPTSDWLAEATTAS